MAEKAKQPEFVIQKLYVNDLSFETPNTPEIFKSEWKPEVKIDLNVKDASLESDMYEVVLKLIVTAKIGTKTAFLVEVNQAGIFLLKGFDKEQFKMMLGSFCPSILFPYAREVVSDLVNRGGFPPLYLAPINFDALYQQQQKQPKQGKKTVH